MYHISDRRPEDVIGDRYYSPFRYNRGLYCVNTDSKLDSDVDPCVAEDLMQTRGMPLGRAK